MHGPFLPLPPFYQLFLLAIAPILGLLAGAWFASDARQVIRWCLVSLCYSAAVVGFAVVYQYSVAPGNYEGLALAVLLVSVFVLPAVGIGWLAGRWMMRDSE